MQQEFLGFPGGAAYTSDRAGVYVSRPTDGTTSVSSSSLMAAFAIPWKLSVPLRGGESVKLSLVANIWASSDSIMWAAIARNGVCVARVTAYNAGSGTRSNTATLVWTDVAPTSSLPSYEVYAGMSGGGTVTVQNPTPDLSIAGSPFRQQAPSQLTAEIVHVISAT